MVKFSGEKWPQKPARKNTSAFETTSRTTQSTERTVGDKLDITKTTVGNVRNSMQEENDKTEVDNISGEKMTTEDEELEDGNQTWRWVGGD